MILPPLPHIRLGLRKGLHCGGEGRGEGAKTGDMAPSPQPSPPQFITSESPIDRGGEGAGNVWAALYTSPRRNPSRRCRQGSQKLAGG